MRFLGQRGQDHPSLQVKGDDQMPGLETGISLMEGGADWRGGHHDTNDRLQR